MAGIQVRKAQFDGEKWKRRIMDAVEIGVRVSMEKAYMSAVEDAPVRSVFRKTGKKGGGLRRGQRKRALSFAEIASEEAVRRQLGLSPAARQTLGRPAPAKINNPYLRVARTRANNPNSFAPFVLRPGTTRKEVKEAREISERAQELGYGRGKTFDMEPEAEIRGGRELTRGGRLRSKRAGRALTARGRYELRSGRAAYTDAKGVTTLGGRLRKEIRTEGPTRDGTLITAQVISPTYYAKYQEFGTRHHRASPYMRPAMLKLVTSYRREIVKAINRANKR